MSEGHIKAPGLIRLQRVLWYLILGWFCLVCVLSVFNAETGGHFAYWGVLVVVVATLLRLLALTETLRRTGRGNLWILGYVLVIFFTVTILLRIYIR